MHIPFTLTALLWEGWDVCSLLLLLQQVPLGNLAATVDSSCQTKYCLVEGPHIVLYYQRHIEIGFREESCPATRSNFLTHQTLLWGVITWIICLFLLSRLTRDFCNLTGAAPTILFAHFPFLPFACAPEVVAAAEKFNKTSGALANWSVFLCQLLGSNNVKYKAVAISTLCISKIPLVVKRAWSFICRKEKGGGNREGENKKGGRKLPSSVH